MERELVKFGGGVSQSVVNPLVLLLIIITGILICFLRRERAVAPFLFASILIPMDQVLVVGGVHFYMLRLLIAFGFARMAWSKGERIVGGINRIDIALILLATITAINWVLLWRDFGALTFQLGEVYTIWCTYFLLRYLIRTQEDIERVLRTLATIVAVIAAVMAFEQIRGWNPYALLGGAQSSFFASTMRREDRFRATGCFLHPILAGTFGAILLPLFFGLWWTGRKNRARAVVGIISCVIMVIASNSSTPIMALGAGLLALALWPIRNSMRLIRWGILCSLVTLHMIMKAPVWALIARVDIVGGSSSDHRYALVDKFIRHFGDWWLIGIKDNGQWGWDMWDTANQYVALGQNSGVVPFILFLALIVYGFKFIGRARKQSGVSRAQAHFCWAVGAALFANVVAFFGISYFDQTVVAWYTLLALISAAVVVSGKNTPAREAARPAARKSGTGLMIEIPPLAEANKEAACGPATETILLCEASDRHPLQVPAKPL